VELYVLLNGEIRGHSSDNFPTTSASSKSTVCTRRILLCSAFRVFVSNTNRTVIV